MALTFTDKAHFAQKGLQFIFGNVKFNGEDAPDLAEGRPLATDGTSLARSDVGEYVLTLPGAEAYQLLHCTFDIVDSTDKVGVLCTGFIEEPVAFVLKVYDLETFATLTDPTDGALLMVQVVLVDAVSPETY
jgi:hypothetical protein